MTLAFIPDRDFLCAVCHFDKSARSVVPRQIFAPIDEVERILQIIRTEPTRYWSQKTVSPEKKWCGMPKVQEPVGNEQQAKTRDDFETPPALNHWCTGRARATMETPKGRFIR